MNHQLEIMEILQKLKQEENKTIIMVLHDLNLAARFSDELVAMRAGKIVKQDAVSAVMTPEVLREVFRIDAQLIQDPTSGRPLLLNYQLCK
jgi:iron complex transport system ATP-binding protein